MIDYPITTGRGFVCKQDIVIDYPITTGRGFVCKLITKEICKTWKLHLHLKCFPYYHAL